MMNVPQEIKFKEKEKKLQLAHTEEKYELKCLNNNRYIKTINMSFREDP